MFDDFTRAGVGHFLWRCQAKKCQLQETNVGSSVFLSMQLIFTGG